VFWSQNVLKDVGCRLAAPTFGSLPFSWLLQLA
jgi:hypothetical protein